MARAFRLASAARSTTTQLRAPAKGQIQPGATGLEQDQPLTTPVLVRGCFVRWWQVLGSNQRRLSRRFYRPLPLATRATCRTPSARDGTLKDSGTYPMRQHPGV